MSASKKLITSVKALAYLAKSASEAKQSNEIAESISCNASKLRQLLALLSKSGILSSIQGKHGGFRINRKLSEISLQEIYCSIEDQKAFHMDFNCDEDHFSHINESFIELFAKIQIEIEKQMNNTSLEQLITKG